MQHHLFDMVDRAAAHISTVQAAILSGAGSATAIAAAVSVDPNWAEWLKVATFAVGLLSGIGGLLLVVLKAIQQLREMRAWAKKNPW
ncbi:hypothetical protein HT051_06430 [Methyloligella sp. GL2]|nr:hypothetical protein HT051_06430 [Methyloligella sp. GL2]